jgi:hypothetical protein
MLATSGMSFPSPGSNAAHSPLTAEERAIKGEEEIKARRDAFLEVTRRLNHSRDDARDPYNPARLNVYRALLQETCDKARDYFHSVEQVISATELLGLQRSDFWANDLARTAANALDLVPVHYQRIREDYRDFCRESAPEPSPDAFYAMQCAVVLHHPTRAAELRTAFEKAGLPVGGFINPAKMNTRYSQGEKYALWGIAIFFTLVMLAIGIFVKDFNDMNILIFRTVLALTAGAFGAVFIPGLFHIEAKWAKVTVTAAGAAAFFVAVFFFNPPALVKNALEKTPSKSQGDNSQPKTNQ